AGGGGARRLLLGRVPLGKASDDPRRRVTRTDLLADIGDPQRGAAALDAFAADDARLVTVDDDGTVELTHEALLRAWPTLRDWIDTDRAGLLVEQQLIDATRQWQRQDRDRSTLYTGTRLATAQQWATEQPRHRLPPAAVEFLDASLARQRAEKSAARRLTT